MQLRRRTGLRNPTAAFVGAAVCLWLSVALCAEEANAARASGAMAFIRVVGDLRVDYRDARQPVVRRSVEVASGSGFVIAPSGLVLTSLHVVDTDVSTDEDGPQLTLEGRRIEVFVGDRGGAGAWEAHVVAADAENDLAALQLTAAELPYLPLGDSEAAEPGRPVTVLGFPFGRQTEVAKREDAFVVPQVTVSAGSLSATREDDVGETRLLQTDAAMHPGSSGGPMLDEDGYVVGVVRMKLSAEPSSSGAGFTVPVDVVKDFLDANGLLERLPSVRLRPGVRHSLDWKQVAVELPDGFADRAGARVEVDAGELGEIGFRAFRWETPWPPSGLEEALLGGEAASGFVPAPVTPGPRAGRERREPVALERGRVAAAIGSGAGTDDSGRRFRVEYAIVDLGREKLAARYLGPADAVAFNRGLLRRSLRSLEAGPLLTSLPRRSVARGPEAVLETVGYVIGEGRVAVPRGFTREPATSSACAALPAAAAGILLRHPADYTLVLRALRFGASRAALGKALAACGEGSRAESCIGCKKQDPTPSEFAYRFERLGVAVAVRGRVVERAGETLLFELEAPVARLEVVEELYESWSRGAVLERAGAACRRGSAGGIL